MEWQVEFVLIVKIIFVMLKMFNENDLTEIDLQC